MINPCAWEDLNTAMSLKIHKYVNIKYILNKILAKATNRYGYKCQLTYFSTNTHVTGEKIQKAHLSHWSLWCQYLTSNRAMSPPLNSSHTKVSLQNKVIISCLKVDKTNYSNLTITITV